ncbi:adenosylmethionine--8-amino-7-oxononanoate transaminase [Parashewanella spongiae]|uniref:Adenosylmethionine-8-amino-7-oxononanoate aminotransferase n=1 Tax=Parashewanella spongiae TaxID=342950 RepID=A0A3A6U5H9_9GAMM|nr:adenosylmethionine--8-amino-7-oxononanoate transaminase [Parashewanella spongiae]MCL1076725.1 adenosylmethionine--8-amino-7-oxononanoate transaminase [Parashewanella spongiae]RJY19468.1 adenosylmethionine--8-amino-7-oxononanoate transaminase [Parashewanella spongiae]
MNNENSVNSVNSENQAWDFDFDRQHIWHPYTSMNQAFPVIGVESADGCELTLNDGTKLIDGTSSWWACVHGYNHPKIISAMSKQLNMLPHIMFGGITHTPAIELTKKLIEMTCKPLTKVFFSDSGSIAVEVAIKMALQYWQGIGKANKQKLITIKRGYHGDSFASMSVCDPDNGMHTMFGDAVTKQHFVKAPQAKFGEPVNSGDVEALRHKFISHHNSIAAMILEPIKQGAGGMYFYSAEYLKEVRALCDEFNVLLIIDEIATGFGRTGKLFAYEHADITPDILCLGKALTGGYISLAATLCTDKVAKGISDSPAGVFMHGPTFMANPLACSAANASLDLINEGKWQSQVINLEKQMVAELEEAKCYTAVKDVRVLGSIGVIEMDHSLNAAELQPHFTELGVWIRVFGSVIYIMPPYTISPKQLTQLTTAMKVVAKMISDTPASTKKVFISHG